MTRLLGDWAEGSAAAAEELFEIVYPELHRLARVHLAGETDPGTATPTVVVHEAFLRLVRIDRIDWRDRTHFFSFSSTVIRRVLVDRARKAKAERRGGGLPDLPLEAADRLWRDPESMLRLDEALDELEAIDPVQSRIVQLRVFTGLNHEEVAEIVALSPSAVFRRWRVARAWLYDRIIASE